MLKQLGIALTAVVVLAACQKKAEAPAPAPAAPASESAMAPAEPAPVAEAVTPAAPASFGVPECDDYVTKYLACIDSKVPAEAREQVRAAFETTRTAWQQAAMTEAGKAGLAAGCTQATEAAKMAMSAYGCTF